MPFFVAIAFALVLTWAARWLGLATGLVDRPPAAEPGGSDQLKIHTTPIPVLGGLGVVAAVLGACLVTGTELPWLVVAGVVMATAVGLVDDVRPQPASVRLVALTVAAVPIAVGLPFDRLDQLALPARVGVVVLLLLMANAVNLIDGQDGLAGGLGAIASVGLAAVIAANGADPTLALVVAGALVGFLAWNLPPARVFLGNGGAYGLGALLTVLAAQATNGHGWHGLLAAALCLGVFAFELTFTVVRRLLGSQRLATGDRRHSYDLLGRSRGNRDRSTLALWTLAAVSAGAGYASDQVSLAAAGTMIGVAFVIGTAAGGRLWRDAVAVSEPQRPTERP
ncbi:MAG TPA: MraY family glycosyltransferase [Actinomycetes bacterium]|jgi:UDP-GlcNAc:undecaprenyl-phosphate/decaprenyl-phosphate GlcNAc-1-phosphate transferase|nr:MraY family glycosyltransferase [Actinomycetes bacterium]